MPKLFEKIILLAVDNKIGFYYYTPLSVNISFKAWHLSTP